MKGMDWEESVTLNPREAAFLMDEMSDIETDAGRHTSEQHEAKRLRQKAESILIE